MTTSVAFKQKSLFRAVPGLFSRRRLFNPATPFDNASVAQQTLTSILDSLGGILWLPNQHNYTLTTDTALADVGDPVGYIGSHRQNMPENLIKNSMMAGGTESSVADTWSIVNNNGITTSIVGAGVDSEGYQYTQVRFSGTASANAYPSIQMVSSANAYDTTYARLFSGSAVFKLVAGTFSGALSCNFRVCRGLKTDGTGSGDVTTTVNLITAGLGSTETKYTGTVILTDPLTVKVRQEVVVAVNSGNAVDFTLQISQPQLERGKPTAFTPTYGEAITRGTNFEPAWQDTTAAKPLLGVDADGKNIFTFDGSNDFFRTGIQTPEAGYIAGVWAHDGTASGRTLFASAKNSATTVGVSVHLQVAHLFTVGRSNGTIETTAVSTIPTPNAKTVIDGHYSTIGGTSRVNGANEGVNVVAANAASENYFRIGAAFNGTAEERFYKGNMLAQVWIPGARPGATTEAEIRRLLAEITAVSGVL